MHFLRHLMSYLLPIQTMVFQPGEAPPVGFDHVITSRGNFVVTARSNFVIAKAYV